MPTSGPTERPVPELVLKGPQFSAELIFALTDCLLGGYKSVDVEFEGIDLLLGLIWCAHLRRQISWLAIFLGFRVIFFPRCGQERVKRSALPKGIITKLLGDTKLVRTLACHLKMQEVITMRDLRLPEFDKNRCINQQQVLVFDNDNDKYDIILGTNFLSKTGIKLNYSEGNMEWFDCSILHIQVEDEIFGEDWLECFATEILDAKYEKTDVA
jgi:hypothetical protein